MKLVLIVLLAICLMSIQSIQIPEQIRISLVKNQPLTYSIMWQSNDTRPDGESILKWGYHIDKLIFNVKGSKNQFSACGYYKSVSHETQFQPKRNSRVFYSLSNDVNGPWTRILDFATETTGSFSFVGLADTDPPTEETNIISKNLSNSLLKYDLVLHAGDYAYDQYN
jgi:hypothetical protein